MTRRLPCHGDHDDGGRPAPQTQFWDWQLRARCRGMPTDIFFAVGHDRATRTAQEEAAKRICRDCRVRAQCLAHALEFGEDHGIWGATTPRERTYLASVERGA